LSIAAARIGRIHEARALRGTSAVGAHVVRVGEGGLAHSAEKQNEKKNRPAARDANSLKNFSEKHYFFPAVLARIGR